MKKRTENNQSLAQRVSIWLVEDNIHFQKTLAELINETEGMHCTFGFKSCEEALKVLESSEPPEVILLDIGLPGMDGVEGVKQFKAASPSTNIIMLTIHDDNINVFNALCAGASGYILKDSSPENAIGAIKEVLAGGAPMNASIAHTVLEMFTSLATPKSNYGLTDREKEILKLMVNGFTKKKIAKQLFVSFHTVNTHLKNIYIKLQVHTLSGAVSKVYKEHLL
jgi:DNA-binding NarL/FixJ family response regulator